MTLPVEFGGQRANNNTHTPLSIRLRDLNDEINKLMREKVHWERRIVELGGPDYSKTGPKITDSQGRVVGDAAGRGAGYRYFGAAKNLPGVKDLFEHEAPRQVRRTRAEMHKLVDGDYYGFRDEEDGVLVKVEAQAEEKLRTEAEQEWEAQEAERRRQAASAGRAATVAEEVAEEERFVAYVPLPDAEEIEARVLESKKAALLSKYTSEALQKEQEQAKALLNRR